MWVHAVSLGEVVAVAPLVRELHARYPGYRILVSTATETGREAAKRQLNGIAEHCYAPLDFPWVVRKFVEALDPAVFLFIETELWPNLLSALAARQVPAILVNGRLSSRSFRSYMWVRPLLAQAMGGITLCLMQSDRDAERIVALGAPSTRVVTVGNIKFDQPSPEPGSKEPSLSRSALGLAEHEELIVAGSTHPGEEEELLATYQRLRRQFSSLVLLLAPRHIERAAQLESVVRAKGLQVRSRSTLQSQASDSFDQGSPRVIVLDTRGELASIYGHAVLTFVGGTLVPVGGHNLLEPAVWGKPVFFGSHTDHTVEISELLTKGGGGVCVRDGEDLTVRMSTLLHDRPALRRMGEAARAVVMKNRGAIQRSLALISDVLSPPETVSSRQPRTSSQV